MSTKISRIMSTQHPDNVNTPFFAEKPIIAGDDEIKEAFYAFSHLGIDEQLWDAEGKEVDTFVVKKLLTRYEDYFKTHTLGKDKFLTMRLPNPDVEKDDGKILIEALHSIPRNFDLAQKFYQQDIPPIFEVVIPMCASEKNLLRVHEYYKQYIIKTQHNKIYNDDITIADWIGKLQPDDIRITPLFETKDAILNADKYVKKYIEYEKIQNMQRVWFARSDTALNYGSLSAVLLGKIGTSKLYQLQEELSIDILPILGCGSAPFRGNFTPKNADKMVKGYPFIQTFTAQSAFKYDYGPKRIIDAVENIKDTQRRPPLTIDIDFANKIITKVEHDYQQSISLLADNINLLSHYIPERRRRKLHVGLFGYARKNANDIQLPRAIKFCAALYSLGLPPDILGLSTITPTELDTIRLFYPTIDQDMADALQYLNKNNLSFFPQEIQTKVHLAAKLFQYTPNDEHNYQSAALLTHLKHHNIPKIQESILTAARIRKFLG